MATNSLPQLDTFQPVSASAVHVLARIAARNAVKEKLRGEGVRVSLVPPSEISEQAQRYLAEHPELYRAAVLRAQRMAEEDELRKAQRRKSRPVL